MLTPPYRRPASPRLYLCSACHEEAPAPPGGGLVSCGACGEATRVPSRGEQLAELGRWTARPRERRAAFREQSASVRGLSSYVTSALDGRYLRPGDEAKVTRAWEDLRRGSPAPTSPEDLVTLAARLAEAPSSLRRPAWVQALLESSIDGATTLEARYLSACLYARHRIAHGEMEAAEEVIASLSAAPPTLAADSQLRVTRAASATARGAHDEVIAELRDAPDRPMAAGLSDLGAVFLADAREHRGDLPGAARALAALSQPCQLARIRAEYPALSLCPRSGEGYIAKARAAAKGGLSANDYALALVTTIAALMIVVVAFPRGLAGLGFVPTLVLGAAVVLLFALMRRIERTPSLRLIVEGQLVGGQITKIEPSSSATLRYDIPAPTDEPPPLERPSPIDVAVRVSLPTGDREVDLRRASLRAEHSHLVGAFVDVWIDPEAPEYGILDPVAALAIDRLASPYSGTDVPPSVL